MGVQYVLDGHIFLRTQIEMESYMTTTGRMINIFTFSFCVLHFLVFFLQEESINLGEKREKKTNLSSKRKSSNEI